MSSARPLALIAAACVAVVGLGTAAPAAVVQDDVTAPVVTSAALSKTEVVTGFTGKNKDWFGVQATVTDNEGLYEVVAVLREADGTLYKPAYTSGGTTPAKIPLRLVSGTRRNGVWERWIDWGARDDQGKFTVEIVVEDFTGNSAKKSAGGFRSREKTRWARFNAFRPGGGKKVQVGGPLEHSWSGSPNPLRGVPVTVQFRRAGTKTWVTIGTAKTNDNGSLNFTTGKVTKTGDWRAVYKGTSVLAPITSKTETVRF